MSEASKPLPQPTLPAVPAFTFLPGLEDGTTLSSSPAGPPAERSGLAHVPASPSRMPAIGEDLRTHGTFGPRFLGLYRSAILRQSLANKLMASLGKSGSIGYALTWKLSTMPSQMSLLTLRASAHRWSDSGFIGWQTPRARGDAGGQRWRSRRARNLEDQARIFCLDRGLTIEEVAALSLSPTFVRRLMGYPDGWDYCTATETRLTPKSQQNL